jgi:hypothetical protein
MNNIYDESLLPVASVVTNVPFRVLQETELIDHSIASPHIESLTPPRRRQLLDYYKRLARHLLSIPKSIAWNPIELEKSTEILRAFGDFKEEETLRLSLAIFQRMFHEVAQSTDNHPAIREMICDWKLLHALLAIWKKASAGPTDNLITPSKLLHTLAEFSRLIPEFQIPPSALTDIWKVAESNEDPGVAQNLLFTMHTLGVDNFELYYRKTLQKWVVSEYPDTSRHLQKLVKSLRRKNVRPSIICYNVIIRFYSNQGHISQIQDLLQSIQYDGLTPQRTTLAQVLYGFVKANKIPEAEQVLWQLSRTPHINVRERKMFAEGVQNILVAYRTQFDQLLHATKQKQDALKEKMEAFVHRVISHDELTNRDKNVMLGTIMDIFARLGEHEEVDKVAERLGKLNPIQMGLLIKSYGMRDQPLRAEELLKNATERGDIDTSMFNSMMHAWTVSSERNPYERSIRVYQLLKEHPNCIKLAVRPNIITYHAMLSALSKSKVKDIKNQIEFIFNEMGSTVKPTALTFSLAIKGSIESYDLDFAYHLVHRMKGTGIIPNSRVFSPFLNHFASIGSSPAAEQAEGLLTNMKNNAISPDNYSYNAVITAWKRSDDPNAAHRIWALYLELKKAMRPNLVNYITILTFFAKSNDFALLLKADEILESMETNGFKPDHTCYAAVVNGWLRIGKPDQAARVLLRQFSDRSRDFRSQRDSLLVDSIIRAFLERNDIEKAHTLIHRMNTLKAGGSLLAGPSKASYESLLANWKTSKLSVRTQRIQEIQEILASSQDDQTITSSDDYDRNPQAQCIP